MDTQTPVNPTALSLSRAIRQAEGGDYNNHGGDAGTSAGAYQWNNGKVALQPGQVPANFRSSAQRFGLNPDDFSPTNQDHVAYEEINHDLKSGLSQSQIAAKWNSGLITGWENHRGTVTINGQPVHYDTPAYVEKVKNYYLKDSSGQNTPSQGYGYVTPPPPPPPAPNAPIAAAPEKRGFFGSLLHGAGDILASAEKPFIGAAAIPTQALAKVLGKPDPFAQGIPAGLPGLQQRTDVTPLKLEQKAGDLAQVGSYLVPGGRGVAGAIAGAAGMGLLQGAGSAMSEGKGLAEVGIKGAEGAAIGGALAGGTALAGAGIRKLGESISGEGQTKAIQGIKDAYSSALNLNASERGFEQRSGKDLAQVLMENKAPLGRYENGTLDASTAVEKLQTVLDPLNQTAQQLLGKPQGIVKDIDILDLFGGVKKEIQEMKIPQSEKDKAIEVAKTMLEAEVRQHGQIVNPQIADEIKRGFQNTVFKKALTSSDQLQGNTAYIISKQFRKAVEEAVAGTDTAVDLAVLNQQRSDLLDAIKRLTKLDGVRLIKGGRLGNMAGGVVGAITGASAGLGPLGTLAGDYFGTRAAEFMNNPATKIGKATLKAKAAGLIPGLVGRGGRAAGRGVSAVGSGIGKSARAVGLVGNLLTK